MEVAPGISFTSSTELVDERVGNYLDEIETMMSIGQNVMKNIERNAVGKFLCFGMGGTGKTTLVKQTAWLLNRKGLKLSYMEIKCNTLVRRTVDGSVLRNHLASATFCARQHLPIMIAFDELDALAPERVDQGTIERGFSLAVCDLVENRFGIGQETEGKILFVGMMNYPELVDAAVRSRLGSALYVPVPGERSIVEILRTRGVPSPKEVTKALLDRLGGDSLCTRALVDGCRKDILHGIDLRPKSIAEAIYSSSGVPYSRGEVERYEATNISYIRKSEATIAFWKRRVP
jgi:AAA+ superfamily predicted ATPase